MAAAEGVELAVPVVEATRVARIAQSHPPYQGTNGSSSSS